MKAKGLFIVLLALAAPPVFGDDSDTSAEASEEPTSTDDAAAPEPQGNGIDAPMTMSGMSILGNEEAPKSLVIIPWKSSELGDNISLSDSLDDRATPVDREVFLRELRFYEIRSEN